MIAEARPAQDCKWIDAQFGRLMAMKRMWWPEAARYMYREEKEICKSVIAADETVVTAGNQLGKDWDAGFITLTFFLAPWLYFDPRKFIALEKRRKEMEVTLGRAVPQWQVHTRRIVTTSVDGDQLRNLWGEIGRFVSTSMVPIASERGGPLTVNMRDISFTEERWGAGSADPLNYLIGRVTGTGEGISGAHAEYTLMVIDEASGAKDAIYKFAQPWAKKFLIFGNPNPTNNFFKKMVKGGSILAA